MQSKNAFLRRDSVPELRGVEQPVERVHQAGPEGARVEGAAGGGQVRLRQLEGLGQHHGRQHRPRPLLGRHQGLPPHPRPQGAARRRRGATDPGHRHQGRSAGQCRSAIEQVGRTNVTA